MSFVRLWLFIGAALLASSVSSCDSVPTGPGTGSGNLLRATINGTTETFTLVEQRYDAFATYSFVSGVSASTKTLTISFTSDIRTGSFPRTLASDDVNIIYIERVGGQDVVYDCVTHNSARAMTLTRNSGGIIDGTFTGTPTNRNDASSTVTITSGEFSVTL
ncbi:MAG TPA: hypothetical protein VNA88_19070 [Candidatus Kapabacteria bacterium]|jgi:hypothetical protein|nr:hypothetical protein [Candidatus Kapabacteria bacterium]